MHAGVLRPCQGAATFFSAVDESAKASDPRRAIIWKAPRFICRANVVEPRRLNVRVGSWSCKSAVVEFVAGSTTIKEQAGVPHALMAGISRLMPMMFITRVRL